MELTTTTTISSGVHPVPPPGGYRGVAATHAARGGTYAARMWHGGLHARRGPATTPRQPGGRRAGALHR
jgi:hypothetical protein